MKSNQVHFQQKWHRLNLWCYVVVEKIVSHQSFVSWGRRLTSQTGTENGSGVVIYIVPWRFCVLKPFFNLFPCLFVLSNSWVIISKSEIWLISVIRKREEKKLIINDVKNWMVTIITVRRRFTYRLSRSCNEFFPLI